MSEDTAAATFAANLDHLARIVAKRDRLADTAVDAAEALVAGLRRAAPDMTMDDKVAVWEQVRNFGIPHLGNRACQAMGTHPNYIRQWQNFPCGSHNKGPFPIGYAELPGKGAHCVYLLMGDDMRCLYVGQSRSVKARLKSHWSEKRIPTTRYEVIVCQDSAEALQLEADLIFQHQPPYNRAGTKRRGFVRQ